MDRPETELNFQLSEEVFEGRCDLNIERIKILSRAFVKLCKSFSKIEEIFGGELQKLQDLDRREEDLNRRTEILLKN